MTDVVRVVSSSEPQPRIEQFADELKHIDDPSWEPVYGTRWLRFRKIGSVKIGVLLATTTPPHFSFALNYGEMERLRNGKTAGKADLIAVVAVRTNEDGRREHCCSVEAENLFQTKLRERPTRSGAFGLFWSLSLSEIEGDEPPL